MFDTLYVYDLLARPYKLVPSVAVALPDVSADGKTWTIKVRPGIYFADDPVFKGKQREADGRRFRLRMEADPRPEDALAGAGGARRQD